MDSIAFASFRPYNARMSFEDIPLSLYIHVPWCERKCPYCDFNSHLARQEINEPAYIQALLDDLDADICQFGDAILTRQINTVFIGGGTPSLFSAKSYNALFKGLRQRLNFKPDAEVTLEANPGSSEASKFSGFRDAGINRLSIGVQSFNVSHLKKLGRIHNTDEAVAAAGFAKAAGFGTFNLDLMFGLPEQSGRQALSDLEQAIALAPTHLSCYQLTIEPNTLFHHNPPVTPDDDTLWEMQSALQEKLAKTGYNQYEVSAYAKDGRECSHNLNYWNFGDYLGIGAGAHGKITTNNVVRRSWKIKHPTTYLEGEIKVGGLETVEGKQLSFEYMLNALRLRHGFSLNDFEKRCFQGRESITYLLEKHEKLGLISVNEDHLKPTSFGFNMLNSMLEDYLSHSEGQPSN